MSAAEAAYMRAPARRPHDSRSPSLIPPIAAGHRDPIVRELVKTLTTLYERRHALRRELIDSHGDLTFPAFPELLLRPPKKVRGDDGKVHEVSAGPDYDRRRSDGMEAIIRVILVLASCCDWTEMEVMDPQGGYLSVWRIAELAQLPARLVAPRDEDDRQRRFRQDTVERVLRALRIARVIPYTRQHREELKDGRHTTTAPAVRKLSVSFFRKFGGALLKTFDWRRGQLRDNKSTRQRRAFKAGKGIDLRTAEVLRNMTHAARAAQTLTPEPSNVTMVAPPTQRDLELQACDVILKEHPTWTIPQLFAEARRRLAHGLEPPTSSSSEPPASE